MKTKVRLLSLVVSFTLTLLTVSATLVVLGIFNDLLDWDIFGPRLEALLTGVFGACMALAGFGVVMASIIAMQETVRDFKKFVSARTREDDIPEAPRKAYAARMFAVVVVMAGLVALCALINRAVLAGRCTVFKRLAAEQVNPFEPAIARVVETFPAPPRDNVPRDLYDLIRSLDDLDFIHTTTLYLADPNEPRAMWGYTAWRKCYTNSDGFARFYVAKDFEKAMRKAMDGDPADLDGINRRDEFIWYKVLPRGGGEPLAVIRIDGHKNMSFREYRLGQ